MPGLTKASNTSATGLRMSIPVFATGTRFSWRLSNVDSSEQLTPALTLLGRLRAQPRATLQVLRLEASPITHVAPRHHEHPVAAVVDCRRIVRRDRYVRLHHVEHKQAIALDQARVDQLALEVRIALRDEWRTDLRRIDSGEPELLELVNVRPVAVPDSDHGVYQVERRDVDHAFLAPADERKAVVLVPDIAADESRLKSQHHVPAESHDVPLTPVRRADEHDGPRLEEAADLRERKALFLVGSQLGSLHVTSRCGRLPSRHIEFAGAYPWPPVDPAASASTHR